MATASQHPTENHASERHGIHADTRRQVLVWIAAEFLQSPGMIRILHEAELLPVPEEKWHIFLRSAQESGGFALGGHLAEVNHGAGIWISPESSEGLEVMIPWPFIRSVVTAPAPDARKVFGLARNGNLIHGADGAPK